jgi:periplasmic divalent cation tolerance protein
MNAIVVFMTAENKTEAEKIAKILVEKRLAACVQILPEITSFYRWQGDVQQDNEVLLLVKTIEENFEMLEQIVRENHSYQTPEIVAVPASGISVPYYQWLLESTVR